MSFKNYASKHILSTCSKSACVVRINYYYVCSFCARYVGQGVREMGSMTSGFRIYSGAVYFIEVRSTVVTKGDVPKGVLEVLREYWRSGFAPRWELSRDCTISATGSHYTQNWPQNNNPLPIKSHSLLVLVIIDTNVPRINKTFSFHSDRLIVYLLRFIFVSLVWTSFTQSP